MRVQHDYQTMGFGRLNSVKTKGLFKPKKDKSALRAVKMLDKSPAIKKLCEMHDVDVLFRAYTVGGIVSSAAFLTVNNEKSCISGYHRELDKANDALADAMEHADLNSLLPKESQVEKESEGLFKRLRKRVFGK